jgi:hypothetical protein
LVSPVRPCYVSQCAGSGATSLEDHRMRLAILSAALAGLAVAAVAADPAAEAAASYAVRASAEPASLRSGASGTLRLAIEPTGAVHVDPKAPIQVTLGATPGLTLKRTRLGRPDAVQAGTGLSFQAPFTAAKPGPQELRAKLDFFVCTDQWCVKQVRDVTVAVDVK